MRRRFAVRKAELLAGCEVQSELFDGVRDKLRKFVAPFAELMLRAEQRSHVGEYVEGLLSDLDTKNAESIAYLHGLERKTIQHFLGASKWDHEPLLDELARQVGERIGEEDGVIIFDPSAHSKKGEDSVGVGRQWSGRAGSATNCQVGVYMAYASRNEHALIDERLGADSSPFIRSPIEWRSAMFLPLGHLDLTKDPVFTDNLLLWLLDMPRGAR